MEILQYSFNMTYEDKELYRVHMISRREYERRVRAETEMDEKCFREFCSQPPPCVHAWHVVGLLNLAVKKTHAKRKPLELQYPECFMEGS